MDDNKKFWAKAARMYEHFTRGTKLADQAYSETEKEICRFLHNDMKVLELAAGPGIMSSKIAEACKTLEVTDFSPEMLKQAKKQKMPENVHFAVADATCLPYGSFSFDAVVISNALHIMPAPEKASSEIKRVLKKGGILIAPTFIRENGKKEFTEIFLDLFGFKTYSRWTILAYKNFMKKQGLSICYEKIIKGYSFPISFLVCKDNIFKH